jgi:DNA-binding response OmpR family regulator
MEYFSQAGHQVSHEPDGRAAMALIKSLHPAVLVTTVVLFGVDGFELREVAKAEMGSDCGCLLLTGLASDGTPLKAWAGDFESYCISRDVWQIILCIEQLLMYRLVRREVVAGWL